MGYSAVIVADAPGLVLDPYMTELATADLVIAADGGARHLIGHQRLPDLAVGDFDSLEPELLAELEAGGVELDRHPVHKDETDLELAIIRAVERGADQITVLGALGGRPDQHFANLQLLLHPALRPICVRLLHRGWEIWATYDVAQIQGRPNDTVSLLPMTAIVEGVRTEGLHYPLRDEQLYLGPARGVSNVLIGTEATVHIRAGVLLVMHQFGAP